MPIICELYRKSDDQTITSPPSSPCCPHRLAAPSTDTTSRPSPPPKLPPSAPTTSSSPSPPHSSSASASMPPTTTHRLPHACSCFDSSAQGFSALPAVAAAVPAMPRPMLHGEASAARVGTYLCCDSRPPRPPSPRHPRRVVVPPVPHHPRRRASPLPVLLLATSPFPVSLVPSSHHGALEAAELGQARRPPYPSLLR